MEKEKLLEIVLTYTRERCNTNICITNTCSHWRCTVTVKKSAQVKLVLETPTLNEINDEVMQIFSIFEESRHTMRNKVAFGL